MALSDDIDALYGLPLDEFTRARNDLARRLRGERKPEDAAEVAGLRKPTAAAWVVNQLVRERPDEVRALLAAANEIRAGAEDGDARFRETVDRLARSAREILASSGRTASDHVVQEVVTTLRTVAATEPEALETGRLTEGREASGFDALAGAAPKRAPRAARDEAACEEQGVAAVDRPRRGRRGAEGALRRPHRGTRAPAGGGRRGARGRARPGCARARGDARHSGAGRSRRGSRNRALAPVRTPSTKVCAARSRGRSSSTWSIEWNRDSRRMTRPGRTSRSRMPCAAAGGRARRSSSSAASR